MIMQCGGMDRLAAWLSVRRVTRFGVKARRRRAKEQRQEIPLRSHASVLGAHVVGVARGCARSAP